MKYMHEIRCANSDQGPEFQSRPGIAQMFCNVRCLVKEDDVKDAVSGRCYNCNSNEWYVSQTFLTEKEYFKKMLQDPDGTVGYHMKSKKTLRTVT